MTFPPTFCNLVPAATTIVKTNLVKINNINNNIHP